MRYVMHELITCDLHTYMSIILIVGSKCTLAAFLLPLVSHSEYADGTDRWTDARPLHYAFR